MNTEDPQKVDDEHQLSITSRIQEVKVPDKVKVVLVRSVQQHCRDKEGVNENWCTITVKNRIVKVLFSLT